MGQTIDTSNLADLSQYAEVGYALGADILTTAQIDEDVEFNDVWPEGNYYSNKHRGERTALVIRYWKKVKGSKFKLDREPERVLLNTNALLESFGVTGIETYLLRRLSYEYNYPYSVSWRSDDPEMGYSMISDPQFATLKEAAGYIVEEINKSTYQKAEDAKELVVKNIGENMGLRTTTPNATPGQKYPGGSYQITHQTFHLEVDYPEKPAVLYTVKWESTCAGSHYNVETNPVLASMQETSYYLQKEVMKNGQFANPRDFQRSMLFDRTAYGKISKEREVVMVSVFDNSIVGKYVVEELDPANVIGSWAYNVQHTV